MRASIGVLDPAGHRRAVWQQCDVHATECAGVVEAHGRTERPARVLRERRKLTRAIAFAGKPRNDDIAAARGQSLAQMAIAWTLRDTRVTSIVTGASSVAQLEDSVGALASLAFSADELAAIDALAEDAGVDLWAGARKGEV